MIRSALVLAAGALVLGAAFAAAPSIPALVAGALVGPALLVAGAELALRARRVRRARARARRRRGYVHR